MLTDFHIHTAYRPGDDGDGVMTVGYIVEHSRRGWYDAVGISPHFGRGNDGGTLRGIRELVDDVDAAMDVFVGCETDVLDVDGTLAIDEASLSVVDYLIAAGDHFNCGGVEQPPVDLAGMIDYQHAKLMVMVICRDTRCFGVLTMCRGRIFMSLPSRRVRMTRPLR